MTRIFSATLAASALLLGSCASQSHDWRDWRCNTESCDDKQKQRWCENMCEHIVQAATECSKFKVEAEETCEQFRKK